MKISAQQLITQFGWMCLDVTHTLNCVNTEPSSGRHGFHIPNESGGNFNEWIPIIDVHKLYE